MWDELREFGKFVVGFVLLLAVLSGVISPLVYHSCKSTAKVVNEEFGTSYTAGDIFWSGETIKTVVLGQRARIDLRNIPAN